MLRCETIIGNIGIQFTMLANIRDQSCVGMGRFKTKTSTTDIKQIAKASLLIEKHIVQQARVLQRDGSAD